MKFIRFKLGITFKLLIAFFAFLGATLSFFFGFINGYRIFFYFTQQSNIAIGIVALVMIGAMLKQKKDPNYEPKKSTIIVYEVFTTGILLTGIVFCFILFPAFFLGGEGAPKPSSMAFIYPSIMLHVINPILALLDILLTARINKLTKKDALWALIFPLAYFTFATIGFICNLDFNRGDNFPYFFLNYASPAGIFGFSRIAPYYMGSFYWILIGLALILCISFGLIYFSQRLYKRASLK